MSFMDVPPVDHGSDRYDYIEIEGPPEVMPSSELLAMCADPCPDCRANVFLRWSPQGWERTVAHDETCPAMTAMEGR